MFAKVKVGDVCICYDEYIHDYVEHKVKVNSIEYDREYATKTNPSGKVCFVTDLDYEDDEDNAIGVMHEGNFLRIETSKLFAQLTITTEDTDVYVNGDLFTFDGDTQSVQSRIVRAIARYYGFNLSSQEILLL